MTFDPVHKPSHYTEGRKYETIDIIEDWELGFHLGNAVKYISRAGRKDPDKTYQDISKAIWYLERFQDQLMLAADKAEAEVPFEFKFEEGDQEEIEFAAMGEIPSSVMFGSDEMWDPSLGPVEPSSEPGPFAGKDLTKFGPTEIVTTYEEGDMILGLQKNGDVRVLKHADSLYDKISAEF